MTFLSVMVVTRAWKFRNLEVLQVEKRDLCPSFSLCWLSFPCRNLITSRERIRSAKGVRSECRPCRKCTINLALVSSRKWRYSRDDWRGVDGKKICERTRDWRGDGKVYYANDIFRKSAISRLIINAIGNVKRIISAIRTHLYIMYIILRKEYLHGTSTLQRKISL